MLNRIARRLPGYVDLHPLMDGAATAQTSARKLASELVLKMGPGLRVLDLGCGEGSSATWFEQLDSSIAWNGVDIEDSPEVLARREIDPRMVSFDGVNIPFQDASFDMIYCHQVLEHVRHPYELIAEVRRVLKPNAIFVGSVAYLEPYHSFSVFNFTPFGMAFVLETAGLKPNMLKHSSDGFYKILRQMLGGFSFWSYFSRFSLIYGLVEFLGIISGSKKKDMNLLKIQYSGSFCFIATKYEDNIDKISS